MDLILNITIRFLSLKEDDVTEIGINRAIELIQKNIEQNKELVIGKHPETNEGDYFKKKGLKEDQTTSLTVKKNFPIPNDLSNKKISLERGVGNYK